LISFLPIVAAVKQDGQGFDLVGLDQRQHFKQFVQSAKAPRKSHQRFGAHQKMHFAHGEIVELEGQAGRQIGVAFLLHGQGDVQPHGGGAFFKGTPVGRFHQAGAAPGANHHALAGGHAGAVAGHQMRKLPGRLVIAGLSLRPLGLSQLRGVA